MLKGTGTDFSLGGQLVPSCQMGSLHLTLFSLKVVLGEERSTPSEVFPMLPWWSSIGVWCKSPRKWSLFRRATLGDQCALSGWRKYAPCRAIVCVLASEVTDNHWFNCDGCIWCMNGEGIGRSIFCKGRKQKNLMSLGVGDGDAVSRSCWRGRVSTDLEKKKIQGEYFNRKREKLYIPFTVFCILCSRGTPRDLLLSRWLSILAPWSCPNFCSHPLTQRCVMSFVWASYSCRLSPMISRGIWELDSGSRRNYDGAKFPGILLTSHWNREQWFGVWGVIGEGETAHWSERHVAGRQFAWGPHGICRAEGAFYSLKVVW